MQEIDARAMGDHERGRRRDSDAKTMVVGQLAYFAYNRSNLVLYSSDSLTGIEVSKLNDTLKLCIVTLL